MVLRVIFKVVFCLFDKFIYLFIYVWLRWVFVAAPRLSLVVLSAGGFLTTAPPGKPKLVFLKKTLTQGSSLCLRAGSPFPFLSVLKVLSLSPHTQMNFHTIQCFSPEWESLIQKSPKAQNTFFSSCRRSPYFTHFNEL